MYSVYTSLFFCIRSKPQDHVAVCVEILEESGKLTEYRRGIGFLHVCARLHNALHELVTVYWGMDIVV